jgi:uncharacterized membrane protein YheB (UPF0754 family)
MLFHPREPRNILGIKIQGVYPKKQMQFATQLGKLVSREFLTFTELETKISSPETLGKVMPMIEVHIDDFLRHRLGKEMPMISMFIGDKTISKMKEALMKEINTLFPEVMRQYASNLQKDLDIENLVVQKISSFSPDKLEALLNQSLSKELRFVGLFGALIGLIIGLLQMGTILLTN